MIFFARKKRQLYRTLVGAFPKECARDVLFVVRALLCLGTRGYGDTVSGKQRSVWRLPTGEKIKIPYRIYIKDTICPVNRFTGRQRLIYHCIFSRSYDGYVRQKHIEAILEHDVPEWAMPYVIKICGEYVKDILHIVYEKLKNQDCDRYKLLCRINFENTKLEHAHMLSYWSEYYRNECYRHRDYIGTRLYAECFGYRKTGQKGVEF